MYFVVIGNDERMVYAAQQLYELGCEVGNTLSHDNNEICILIQPPVTETYLNIIQPYMNNISIIYGGQISDDFIHGLDNSIKVYDYLTWPKVIGRNAELTAQGIIKETIAFKGNPVGKKCMVTGFGYCGKAIANALRDMGAVVSVAVRNHKLKKNIIDDGFDYLDFNVLSCSNLYDFKYIYNTVPSLVITNEVIDKLCSSVMIFDIASKPGGVDFDYCGKKGIFAKLVLGIPGKEFPKEAGELIAMSCYNHYML